MHCFILFPLTTLQRLRVDLLPCGWWRIHMSKHHPRSQDYTSRFKLCGASQGCTMQGRTTLLGTHLTYGILQGSGVLWGYVCVVVAAKGRSQASRERRSAQGPKAENPLQGRWRLERARVLEHEDPRFPAAGEGLHHPAPLMSREAKQSRTAAQGSGGL